MVCAASTSEPHLAQEAGNRMSVQPNTSNLCGHVLDFGVLRVHLTLQLASLSRMLKLVFLKLLNSVFTWRLSLYKLYTLSICFKFDYLLKNVCHVWGHVWVHWQTAYVNTCLTTKARVDRVRESLYVSASSHFSHEYVYMCVCVCGSSIATPHQRHHNTSISVLPDQYSLYTTALLIQAVTATGFKPSHPGRGRVKVSGHWSSSQFARLQGLIFHWLGPTCNIHEG